MGMYKFLMSCGHEAKREVAEQAIEEFKEDLEKYFRD